MSHIIPSRLFIQIHASSKSKNWIGRKNTSVQPILAHYAKTMKYKWKNSINNLMKCSWQDLSQKIRWNTIEDDEVKTERYELNINLSFKNHPKTEETQKMQQYQLVLSTLIRMLSPFPGILKSWLNTVLSTVLQETLPGWGSWNRQYPLTPSKLIHLGICVTVQENKIYIRSLL